MSGADCRYVMLVRAAAKPRREQGSRRQPQYQREHRERAARGARKHWVEIGPKVILALLERGLPEADSRDPKKVAAELAEVLAQWADQWLK